MTARELEQLRSLVEQGLSDAAIASRMGVTSRTVLRWRTAHGIASQWQPERAPHGTIACYQRGCRRPECKAANADEQRLWRAAMSRVDTPHNEHAPWTPEDDQVLLHGDGTVASRARRLGRSYVAASLRLTKLRKDTPP